MAHKTSELIKQRLIELAADDKLPLDMTQLDAALFDPYTSNKLYVIDGESQNISTALGIDNQRSEELCKHLSDCMIAAYFGKSKDMTRADLMAEISSVCENKQELGYIMFKFGLEDVRYKDKMKELFEYLNK